VNELKTRGREAPDGLLFYFHNSKDADEQSEVGHPGMKKFSLPLPKHLHCILRSHLRHFMQWNIFNLC